MKMEELKKENLNSFSTFSFLSSALRVDVHGFMMTDSC